MSLTHPLRRTWTATMLICVLFSVMAHPANAQIRRMSNRDIATEADQIFIATCTDRESVIQGGTIVTKYKLRPSEFWKGSAKLNKTGEIEFEELGGQLPASSKVPLGTQVPGMADIDVGEDVLLFTRNATDHAKSGKPQGRKILSPTTLHIVGRDQGRFSIFKHPETGALLVARHQPKSLMALVDKEAQNRAARQIQALRAKGVAAADTGETTQTQLSRLQAEQEAGLNRSLGMRFDKAQARSQKARDSEAAHNPDVAEDIYPFEPLDSVKARVLRSLQP